MCGYSPLQGVFLTQELNPHLYASCTGRRALHCQHRLGSPGGGILSSLFSGYLSLRPPPFLGEGSGGPLSAGTPAPRAVTLPLRCGATALACPPGSRAEL